MPKEILPLDEVERKSRQFAREKWNGDVTVFQSVWPCPADESSIEVAGRLKKHELRPEMGNYIDAIMEYSFKLQISANDREVISYWIEQPSPPKSQPEQIIVENVEPLWTIDPYGRSGIPGESSTYDILDRLADIDLKKAKTKYWKEKGVGRIGHQADLEDNEVGYC